MKTAWLYAGQGSQRQGMGKDMYERFPEFAKVIDESAEYTDFDLKKMMFEESMEVLSDTEYTQPCLAAFAAGVTEVLKEAGLMPDIAAGLSLGEYSALYVSGVFDLETLIRTTAFRGNIMHKASEGTDTLMCAILGMTSLQVEQVAADASSKGRVSISNYNAAGQYVLSGEKEAVEYAKELAMERGAKKCRDLKTSGPFHTPFMSEAAEELYEYLRGQKLGEMSVPVVFNSIGRPLERGLEDNETTVKALLKEQMVSGVRMEQSIRCLAAMGVTEVVEIGPGHVLTGFVRRTEPEIGSRYIDTAEQLETVINGRL